MIARMSRGEPYFITEHREARPRTWTQVRPPGSVDPLKCDWVEALLDTGSQWSYLPVDAISECDVGDERQEAGGLYSKREHRVCYVDLSIFFTRLYHVRVLIADSGAVANSRLALIGRDVLWQFKITFDGPGQRWDVIWSKWPQRLSALARWLRQL